MIIEQRQPDDDLTLTIDLSILNQDQILITRDTQLTVSTDGRTIMITPSEVEADEIDDAAFEATVEKINRRFGRALQRLAE